MNEKINSFDLNSEHFKMLRTTAEIDNLKEVLDFISSNLEQSVSAGVLTKILISAEEIFVNISNYAYNPETGAATIRLFAAVDGTVVLVFEDEGAKYNPLEKSDPDTNATLDERNIGGLGIFMVKQMMDFIDYKRENGRNILVFGKHKP
jgi:anti-sigma regulatory factor (Ser/Thr protein kinase)